MAGTITLATGKATITDNSGKLRTLRRGSKVYTGDTINTGTNSYANIHFTDGGKTLIRPNSRFQVVDYEFSPKSTRAGNQAQGRTTLQLLKGGLRTVTGKIGQRQRNAFAIRTPVATVGIRGTDFSLRYCNGDCYDIYPLPNDGLYSQVHEGGINLGNGTGNVAVFLGQSAYTPAFGQDTVIQSSVPEPLKQDPLPDPRTCD